MAYIGSTPTSQNFISGTDYYNGTGSQTAFTLTRSVNSVNDIDVVVNNVIQQPNSYTVSGSTLTLSAAPSSGTSNVYVRYLSTTNISVNLPQDPSIRGNLNLATTGARITGDFSNATVANRVLLQTSTTNSNTAVGIVPNGTGVVSTLAAYNNSDPTNASTFQIQSNASDGRLTSGITGTGTYLPLAMYTGGSERLRIDTSGNLLVGATSGTGKFRVEGSVGAQYIDSTGTNHVFTRNGVNYILANGGTSAVIQVISNTGGVQLSNGATSWTAISDETKKDIIEPITDATSKVSTLRSVIGKYKTDEEGTRRSFLIAQDVQAVLPEAVSIVAGEDGDSLGLSYTDVIPLLVASIKEQQVMIEELKTKVAALEVK